MLLCCSADISGGITAVIHQIGDNLSVLSWSFIIWCAPDLMSRWLQFSVILGRRAEEAIWSAKLPLDDLHCRPGPNWLWTLRPNNLGLDYSRDLMKAGGTSFANEPLALTSSSEGQRCRRTRVIRTQRPKWITELILKNKQPKKTTNGPTEMCSTWYQARNSHYFFFLFFLSKGLACWKGPGYFFFPSGHHLCRIRITDGGME